MCQRQIDRQIDRYNELCTKYQTRRIIQTTVRIKYNMQNIMKYRKLYIGLKIMGKIDNSCKSQFEVSSPNTRLEKGQI